MSSRSVAWLPLVGGLGLLLLAGLFLFSGGESPTAQPEAHEQEEERSFIAPPAPELAVKGAVDVQEARAEEPRAAIQEPEPNHAHPVTAEHARLYRDVDMLEAAKDALAQRDFATARAILAQHRVEFPKGYPERVEGYEIIADCLENPGPETTARAQRYHDEKRASVVRRQVRKACLTPPS